MKAGDLRQLLEGAPDNLDVLVASDAEGNRIRRVADVSPEWAEIDGWEISLIHPDDLEDQDCAQALVIWPV